MISVSELPKLVSIGITTKNRWQDLKITLERIKDAGLDSLPIFIFDDGSDEIFLEEMENSYPQVTYKRFAESKGLIVRRNQLAQTIATKYYLSLDDDSYPVSGSLASAVKFAESIDQLLCLSFPVYNPTLHEYQNRSLSSTPYPVRCFIGCGHLLHRERFLHLGGYREELVHQGEEMELAARAFHQFFCCHFPGLLIHHTASNTGRSWHRMDYYGARNNVLWNDWFVPKRFKIISQTRTLGSRVLLAARVKRWGQIQGVYVGFKDILKYRKYRQNMSDQSYKKWQSLPYT